MIWGNLFNNFSFVEIDLPKGVKQMLDKNGKPLFDKKGNPIFADANGRIVKLSPE